MKLSDRLEAMLTARLNDEQAIIREAMELARRVEEAPVVLMTFGEYTGKRVRIVEE